MLHSTAREEYAAEALGNQKGPKGPEYRPHIPLAKSKDREKLGGKVLIVPDLSDMKLYTC